jgi:anti-anti-sigma regulatory factor
MGNSNLPHFLVDASTNPVVLKISGRATYLNTGVLGELFTKLLDEGKTGFVIDCQTCTGMDSTFMGLVASVALRLELRTPTGSVVLCNLSPHQYQTVHNLGLHRILKIIARDKAPESLPVAYACMACEAEPATKAMILEAHESLMTVQPSNQHHFQDVVTFLKQDLSLV